MTRHSAPTALAVPAFGTGIFMALYLLTRPYGDGGPGPAGAEALQAFASTWWVFSHVCGMLALASAARLALRMHDLARTRLTAVGRWAGLAGLVLVLPYYGAEAFALHVIGARSVSGALDGPAALALAELIRSEPTAMALFGAGLVLLAISGVSTALAWRSVGTPRWAAWPLGLAIALVLPQFYLPAAGRMAFGIATLAAALVLVVAAVRAGGRRGESLREPVPSG